MSFWQAIASGFSNYVNFKGRAVRSEYWYWGLFVSIVSVAAMLLDVAFVGHRRGPIESIWHLVTFLPGLALTVRRLHDMDRTGWWLLVIFVVVLTMLLFVIRGILVLPMIIVLIGAAVLIYWFCQPGTPGPNRYGPDPFAGGGYISARPTT